MKTIKLLLDSEHRENAGSTTPANWFIGATINKKWPLTPLNNNNPVTVTLDDLFIYTTQDWIEQPFLKVSMYNPTLNDQNIISMDDQWDTTFITRLQRSFTNNVMRYTSASSTEMRIEPTSPFIIKLLDDNNRVLEPITRSILSLKLYFNQ
jgi:hypothetical protein